MPRTIVRKAKKDEAMGLTTEGGSSSASEKTDEFLGKLAKYIPAEITAAYLFILGIISGVAGPSSIILWIALIVLAAFAPIYFYYVALKERETPDKAQIIISIPAFLIWAFAIGGPFTTFSWYNQAYGAALVGIATVAIPMADFFITRNK